MGQQKPWTLRDFKCSGVIDSHPFHIVLKMNEVDLFRLAFVGLREYP